MRPWQHVAQEAQEHRDASIARVQPEVPQLPPNLPTNVINIPHETLGRDEIRITEMTPEGLLGMLASGNLTATAVTRAFLRRAALAQKLTNCITELLVERALARARYLDDYYIQQGKPLGPLHGLPVSVKEHIGMEGLSLNAGYVAWWGKTGEEDARVLQILWRAGAVFHARTTQPQTLMHLETDSNLYGVTVNPYNRDVSAGGSSGGEGSIRSPAANNGIYGLKPTAFRVPTDGWSSTMPGADPIATVIGPLSTSLTGIKLFMQTVLASKPWLSEPALPPFPWNPFQIGPKRPLKIAILWHDNVVMPHPPITRALHALASKLKTIPNITVVDWEPHLHDEAWAIISSLYFTDGGAEDAAAIAASGEPWRPLTKWIIKENPCVKRLGMQEFFYWQEEREAYRKEYAKVWNGTATARDDQTGELEGVVDVILCPAGPGVAPSHNTAKYWGYTSQWNLLDYPALVFPVCKVDAEVDRAERGYKPMNDVDRDHWKLYDPKKFDGLPVSLQLVGRRFEDEKVVAVLEYLKEVIRLPFVEFP
ncbi:MAG: hypothetical protein M1839_002444 [Geoglossum umbratile]|nr:MAG: hypothetical protein M1839_002444 [Geoglossum umbratile]